MQRTATTNATQVTQRGYIQPLYLTLTILGAALPMSRFLPWLFDHGLNVPLFIDQMFANRVASTFAIDVLVSALVLFVFIAIDRPPVPVRQRVAVVVGTCLVGVSFGLPLYLLLRERVRNHVPV